MSGDSGDFFVDRVRQHLDQHAEQVDELTSARLKAMRKTALQQKPGWSFNWLPLTAMTSAAAAILAVAIWYQNPADPTVFSEEWEALASSEELELIEDLEFYDWLETTYSSS